MEDHSHRQNLKKRIFQVAFVIVIVHIFKNGEGSIKNHHYEKDC